MSPVPEASFGYDPLRTTPVGRHAEGHGIGANVRYAFAVMRRNILLAAVIVAVSVAVAVAMAMLTAPRYSAQTTVQINDQSDSVLGAEIDKTPAANTWDIERFLNTQLDVLRSRAIALRVTRKLDLYKNARFFTAMDAVPPGSAIDDVRRREMVIGMLSGNLKVDLPRESRIVRISFTSTDPEISALVANTFADEFVQANLQRRFDSTAYARNFVAEQLTEARTRLEGSERDLNAYAREAGLIRTREVTSGVDGIGGGSSGSSITTSSLMQLNQAANEAEAARVAAESRWTAERNAPLLSSQTVLANSTVQALMTRRSDMQSQLQTARARYLSGHPSIERLETELASINGELNRTAITVRNSVRAQYDAAQATERQLQSQVGRLRGDTLAEQDRTVRYNTLAREADTNRSIYDGLLQRFRELNASSGIAASNLAIIDRADPPTAPSSPNLVKNIALALLLGLGLAVLAVFLRDQFDDRIRVPEDVEGKIHLPLLGVIPRTVDQTPMAALEDPKSPVSEGYNSLRGSLLYSTPDGLPKIIVVTSAQATEGKTTTSRAIAQSLARLGKRTVLIDADMRRPSLHHVSGVSNVRGLSDLLVSRDPAASAIVASGQPNLDLITAGPLPADPTELLASPRIAQLLESLAATYDAVIIDSPPVLGLADAPMLAALADGTVLVIEADRARRGNLKAALRRLKALDPVLLGAVLTKFDAAKGGNSYSSYYGEDYYSYKSDHDAGAAAA